MPPDTTALYGPPKVGGDTLSWCTKCKMELAHVIVSMVENTPAKVICKTCKSPHKYRKGGAPAPRKPRSGVRTAATPKVADLWEKRVADSRAKPGHTYAPTQSFKVGDMIEHTKFGMGFVEEIRGGGKMLVLFREGEKILVYSPQPTNAPH